MTWIRQVLQGSEYNVIKMHWRLKDSEKPQDEAIIYLNNSCERRLRVMYYDWTAHRTVFTLPVVMV